MWMLNIFVRLAIKSMMEATGCVAVCPRLQGSLNEIYICKVV